VGTMHDFARLLLIAGLLLIVISGVIYLIAYLGLPVGRLPGDIRIERNNLTCIFPLTTMIILSILLTVILNLIIRFLGRN